MPLLFALLAGGCSDDKVTTTRGNTAVPVAANAPLTGANKLPGLGGEAGGADPKRPVLVDSDFVASGQNRDPFRSYVQEFIEEANLRQRKSGHPIVAPKYGLDELKLIAIATGGTAPRAMFRDPTGFGVMVGRGEYVSKADAKVVRILSNSVMVEVAEDSSEGAPRVGRKSIALYPEEAENASDSEESPQ
jgi:hypothetical protein